MSNTSSLKALEAEIAKLEDQKTTVLRLAVARKTMIERVKREAEGTHKRAKELREGADKAMAALDEIIAKDQEYTEKIARIVGELEILRKALEQ